mmetsp:Transcript_7722/g.24181  ORF Transcript_7722/g.24181 Transcript_7722/m.24181 type:complete len:226 (+) Transcript_7722:1830-2507(+)
MAIQSRPVHRRTCPPVGPLQEAPRALVGPQCPAATGAALLQGGQEQPQGGAVAGAGSCMNEGLATGIPDGEGCLGLQQEAEAVCGTHGRIVCGRHGRPALRRRRPRSPLQQQLQAVGRACLRGRVERRELRPRSPATGCGAAPTQGLLPWRPREQVGQVRRGTVVRPLGGGPKGRPCHLTLAVDAVDAGRGRTAAAHAAARLSAVGRQVVAMLPEAPAVVGKRRR